MKAQIISHSDISGGAARASYRLHRALLDSGVDSEMLVARKKSDDYSVVTRGAKIDRVSNVIRNQASCFLQRLQKTNNPILHSSNFFGTTLLESINNSNADIINLHWINAETLSIRQISQINKPIVMTLHDMWAFCGCEHYCQDDENSRFRKGYSKENRSMGHSGIDLDRLTWQRKKKYWQQPFTIVTPSRWLSNCARESLLFKGWQVETIPNTLDTDIYKPVDKYLARDLLGLPQDKKLIGFAAIGGGTDPRKGFDLLESALRNVAGSIENVESVICGQSTPKNERYLGMPSYYLGHLNDNISMTLFYNAIDVMVVPSRQEAQSQTGTEAASCGVPVVAFGATGLSDVVDHMQTGYLARPYDPSSLADGILKFLQDYDLQKQMSRKAREKALALWSYNVVAQKYMNLYQSVIESSNEKKS